MVKVTIEMPQVSTCAVEWCAYNVSRACHAKAITVGDQINPDCDTYCAATAHAKTIGITAGVGACKVSGCKFNEDYECTADKIQVGFAGKDIRCLTYSAR